MISGSYSPFQHGNRECAGKEDPFDWALTVYVVPSRNCRIRIYHPGLPQPGDPKAFTLALRLAKEKNAEYLVLATDPDADQTGDYASRYQEGGEMFRLPGICPVC